MGSRREHKRRVKNLADRLEEKDTYETVETHIKFWRSDVELAGEMDVVTYKNNFIHYYEYKCHLSDSSERRARDQAHRFYKHHGRENTQFILVYEDMKAKRIRPEEVGW